MANVFDQFDQAPQTSGGNVFDQFDAPKSPAKIGADAFPDFLKQELANADWGTRNLAGFGTALSNLWEGTKQFVGKGDAQQIQANKIISDSAPLGALAGNAALTAIPFGLAGNTVSAAAKVGTALGALNPVEGDQSAANIVRGKLLGAGVGGATAAAGQVIANKAGDWLSGKLADLAAAKAKNAPIQDTLGNAIDAGLVVPPSSVDPTMFNRFRESVGGKIATAQEASNRNAGTIENLVRQEVGLAPNDPLTSAAMQQVRNQAYKTGYEPVTQIGAVPTDSGYGSALDKIVAKFQGASKDFPGAFKNDVAQQIDALRVPQFDSANGLRASQLLREEASASFRQGDSGLGNAQKSAAKAIEDQIERALSSSGQDGAQLLDQFRNARQLMAKAHDVEDAIVEGGGTIDPRVLARKFQNQEPLSGALQTIGAFANNFPKAVQPLKQVAGPGISKLDLAMATMGGGAGATMGPLGAAAGAAVPYVAPKLARAMALSSGSQNALRDIYKLGLAPRVTNSLLQYAPVGLTVLGTNALSQ